MIPYKILLVRNEFRIEDHKTYIAPVIRTVTGGYYNHIAIEVNGAIIEAVGKGIIRTPIEEWTGVSTRHVLEMIPPKPLTNAEYVRLRKLVGTKYGYGDMVRAGVWYLVEKRWGLEIGTPYNGKGYICSELACLLLGIDWFIVPHEFETLPMLRRGRRYRTYEGVYPVLVH